MYQRCRKFVRKYIERFIKNGSDLFAIVIALKEGVVGGSRPGGIGSVRSEWDIDGIVISKESWIKAEVVIDKSGLT